MMCIGLLAFLGAGVLLGGSAGNSFKSGAFTSLDVQILDPKTLKLEHTGGAPIDLGENFGIYLQYNRFEYKLTPDSGPIVLDVGKNVRIRLPEKVELKNGDSATFLLKDEKKNKVIYRKVLLSGPSD